MPILKCSNIIVYLNHCSVDLCGTWYAVFNKIPYKENIANGIQFDVSK